MEVRRTVPVELDVTDERADLLHETIDEFLWAANCVVDAAWDGEWAETRSSVLRNQTGGEGGAPVGVRLNSGMLNANGVKPLPDSVRAGVHAESPRL